MAIIIGVLLALLAVGVVVYPFLKRRPAPQPPNASLDSEPDGPNLDTIYEDIRTLQLEHQLGNIPQALYREQLDTYRLQAAQLLRQQMEAPGQGSDRFLEQEILTARASLAQTNGKTVTCANCRAAVGVHLTHCPECGVEMEREHTETAGS